jgi:hypothetical protein
MHSLDARPVGDLRRRKSAASTQIRPRREVPARPELVARELGVTREWLETANEHELVRATASSLRDGGLPDDEIGDLMMGLTNARPDDHT